MRDWSSHSGGYVRLVNFMNNRVGPLIKWTVETFLFAIYAFSITQIAIFMLFWWYKGMLPYGNPFGIYKKDYLILALVYAPIIETAGIFIVNAVGRFALPRFEIQIAIAANASIAFLLHEGFTRFPAALIFAAMAYYVVLRRAKMNKFVLFATVCILHSSTNFLNLYFNEIAVSILRLPFNWFAL